MHKLYFILFFLFFCCANSAWGHERISIDGITFTRIIDPDPAPKADFKTLVVPIKRAGNLIIVEATIDSLEGNFVLDTGAPYLVLNATYFRNSPKIDDQDSGGINGASEGSFTTFVRNFKILDLQYSRLTADVTDLSPIENGRGIKILGLLGTRLFSKFAITVDLFRNVLYIQKLDKDGNIPETEIIFRDKFMTSPFRMMSDIIYLKGTVNDKTLWFAFDTGAETNLLDYDKSKKLKMDMQVINRFKVAGVGGSRFEVVYTKFDQLKIGDRVFMNNRVLLTSLEKMGKVYGSDVDGILGYDFFIRGIFTINFVKKEFEMYIYNNQ